MKNIILFFVLASFTLSGNAQNRQCDKLYEDMALREGITMLSFSKKMLDAVNLNFDDDNDGNVKGDLHEVKIVISNSGEYAEGGSFSTAILEYLPLRKYERIEDEDGDDDVEIRILRKGKKVNECHVLFQGEESGVLLSFFGDFTIDDVDEMAGKMDDYK